jgi:dienelactone hydrolase
MQKLTIPTSEGLKLAALFDKPSGAGPFPLVILLHGNPGWKEEEHLSTLAEALCQAGIAALRFDCPGLGESEGTIAKDYRVSKYVAAVKDVYDFAAKNLPIDSQRIGLWGHSRGVQVAIAAISQLPKIAALCGCEPSTGQSQSLTPKIIAEWQKTGWLEEETEHYGRIKLPYAFYQDRAKYNSLDLIKKVHCPTLFIAGTYDNQVSATSIKALYSAANQPKTYQEFPIDHFYKRDPAALAIVNTTILHFFTKLL